MDSNSEEQTNWKRQSSACKRISIAGLNLTLQLVTTRTVRKFHAKTGCDLRTLKIEKRSLEWSSRAKIVSFSIDKKYTQLVS